MSYSLANARHLLWLIAAEETAEVACFDITLYCLHIVSGLIFVHLFVFPWMFALGILFVKRDNSDTETKRIESLTSAAERQRSHRISLGKQMMAAFLRWDALKCPRVFSSQNLCQCDMYCCYVLFFFLNPSCKPNCRHETMNLWIKMHVSNFLFIISELCLDFWILRMFEMLDMCN